MSRSGVPNQIVVLVILGKDVKLQTFLSGSCENPKINSTKDVDMVAGIGLVGKFLNVARFELNFCIPVNILGGGSRPTPSLLFGLGTDFL